MPNPAHRISAVASAPAGFRVVLRNRNFTYLWSAQLLSQIAQNIINFAVLVKVEELSHSTTQIAVTIVSFTLPAVLFGPIAGVFVDRLDKKMILVYTNMLRAVATLGFIYFGQSLPAIYTILFVSSIINQLFSPAEGASIPMLVKRDQLLNAMSLFNVTFYSAVVVGFIMVAPAAIKLAGLDVAFFITVAMYAASAALCAVLPGRTGRLRTVPDPDEPPREWRLESAGQFFTELREGLLYILASGELTAAIIQLTLISTLLLIMGEMAPGFTSRVLDLTAEDTAYVFLPMGAGLIAGMVSTGKMTTLLPKQLLTRISVLGIGVLMFGVGISPPLSRIGYRLTENVPYNNLQPATWLIGLDLFLFLLLGLAFAYVLVPAQTLVQELAGDEIRGRVISIQLMVSSAFTIIPLLFVGGLADAFGIDKVLAGMGVLIAVPFAYSLRKAVREFQLNRHRRSA